MDKRLALNWLEVISFAALVVVGLGIWASIGRLVTAALEDDEPWEEPSRSRHRVVSRNLEWAKAQDELTAIRTKSNEQRLELARESALRDALLVAHPRLAKISPAGTSAVRPDVLLSYAQARMEVEAADLLISDLEAILAQEIETIGDRTSAQAAEKAASPGLLKNPYLYLRKSLGLQSLSDRGRGKVGVSRAELRLSLSQDLLAAARKTLVKARLGRAEKRSRAEALAVVHPGLPRLIKEAEGPPNVPLHGCDVEVQIPRGADRGA
jgi:hypothetical protein